MSPRTPTAARACWTRRDRGQAVASQRFDVVRHGRSGRPGLSRLRICAGPSIAGRNGRRGHESSARPRSCHSARRRRRRCSCPRHHPRRPASRHHHHDPEGQREDSRLRVRALDARWPAANAGGAQPRPTAGRRGQGPRVSVAGAGARRRRRFTDRRVLAWGRHLRDADRAERVRRGNGLRYGGQRHSGSGTRATEITPGFPPEVERIVGQALARDLSQRQQSAALLAAELRAVLTSMEPRTIEPIADETALLPLDERPDKSPAAGLLLGALGAAAVAAVAVWWWLSR